jgi:hypothetical protein
MWPRNFKDRLQHWHRLRTSVQHQKLDRALNNINNFWFGAPWSAYYLHWDDQKVWPNPWQLLNENIYCDIARGLGILYTIAFIEHPEIQDAKLISTTDKHNIITVEPGKYTLNWEPNQLLNKNLSTKTVRALTLREVQDQY